MFTFTVLAVLFIVGLNSAEAISCKAGRAGCVPSCMLQNCATGYCNKDDICVCSRCNDGPVINSPPDITINSSDDDDDDDDDSSKRKKKQKDKNKSKSKNKRRRR